MANSKNAGSWKKIIKSRLNKGNRQDGKKYCRQKRHEHNGNDKK